MNRVLRYSEKRLQALEVNYKKKQSTMLIINLIDRNGKLLRSIKTNLPKI